MINADTLHPSIYRSEHPSMHTLTLNSDFKLGADIWRIADPDGYSVQKREPIQKSIDGFRLDSVEMVSIILALKDSGILEWARSKLYDTAWDYLNAVTIGLRKDRDQPMANFEVQDSNGATRIKVEFFELSPDTVRELRATVRSQIEANSESHTIRVTLKK